MKLSAMTLLKTYLFCLELCVCQVNSEMAGLLTSLLDSQSHMSTSDIQARSQRFSFFSKQQPTIHC